MATSRGNWFVLSEFFDRLLESAEAARNLLNSVVLLEARELHNSWLHAFDKFEEQDLRNVLQDEPA